MVVANAHERPSAGRDDDTLLHALYCKRQRYRLDCGAMHVLTQQQLPLLGQPAPLTNRTDRLCLELPCSDQALRAAAESCSPLSAQSTTPAAALPMSPDETSGWADEAELAFLHDLLDEQDNDTLATAQRRLRGAEIAFTSSSSDTSNSSSACSLSMHSSAQALAPESPTKAKKMPKFASTRARQQHQKRELEALIRDLEATVAQLQTTQPQPSARVPLLALAPYDRSTKSPPEASYASLVETERALLTHAQRTNKQLRRTLLHQKKLARSLQQVLLARVSSAAVRRSHVLSSDASLSLDRTDRRSPPLCVSLQLVREQLGPRYCRPERLGLATRDFTVFQTMVLEINRMYARIPTQLRALELETRASGSYRRWNVRKDAALDAVTLHVVACDELPFERAAVDAAMTAIRQSTTKPGYRRLDARVRT